MKNKLYIVLINHNGYQDTIECLESILKQKLENYQILVIDNSESIEYIERIKDWTTGSFDEEIETNFPKMVFPLISKPLEYLFIDEEELENKKYNEDLVLVRAKENNGFAAANNIGLRYIQQFGNNEDIIWILNNDTVIAANMIDKIRDTLENFSEEKKESTLFGTPLLDYRKPNTIQALGGKYNKFFATTSHLGAGLPVYPRIRIEDYKVDYPIGASMIVSNKFVKENGLLNEEYFLFFEEMDWVERLKKINGSVQILDIFGVYHKQGSTIQVKEHTSKSEFIDLLSLRNRILFTSNYYKRYICSVILFILTVSLSKRIISGDLKRIPKIIALIFKTYFEKKRKSI